MTECYQVVELCSVETDLNSLWSQRLRTRHTLQGTDTLTVCERAATPYWSLIAQNVTTAPALGKPGIIVMLFREMIGLCVTVVRSSYVDCAGRMQNIRMLQADN